MAITVTRNWSAASMQEGLRAHEEFDVTGVNSLKDALRANGSPFGNIPQAGTGHFEDPTLLADAPEGRILTPGALYRVMVDFSRLDLKTGIAPTDVLNLPAKFSSGDEEETEETDEDLDGNALVYSNGDPIDPPPTIQLTRRIIRATWWVEQFDNEQADSFQWTTNDEPITIPKWRGVIPSETMLCRSISPINEWDRRSTAIQVQAIFAIRKGTWNWRFLDQGFSGWYESSGDFARGEFKTLAGTQLSRPILLNGKGKPYEANSVQVESGESPIEIGTPDGASIDDTGSAVFLRYGKYDTSPFTALGIF